MTTEREMLEAAAKAAAIDLPKPSPWFAYTEKTGFVWLNMDGSGVEKQWNPLTSSADCAAMCAKLMIGTLWISGMDAAHALTDDYEATALTKDHNNDREAAWRYAATMVAAKVGGMK